MVRKEHVEVKENVRGGVGSIEFRYILEGDELLGHADMFARLILKPHSSIGWHQHEHNTEPYLILRGEGVFTDNDGSKTVVKSGDVCTIEVGHSHSIENNSDEDLELIALILKEKK